MSGFYLRGALVEFRETFMVPIPNVIVFQFNPESMTHTWQDAEAEAAPPEGGNPLGVSGLPGESFGFSLAMDAADAFADGTPATQGLALTTGIYSRLAALELLKYPVPSQSGALATANAAKNAVKKDGGKRKVPAQQLPTVLFVWGPGRILPVKVTQLTITETLYDEALNPTHADATIELQVLTTEQLASLAEPLKSVATGAYNYSQKRREVAAIANLANSVDSIIGMVPWI